MSDPFLLYGATGYTGRLIAATAKARGMRPILCARDERRLAAVADGLGLERRTAVPDGLDAALHDIAVVVNAAGPFSATAGPVVNACLRAGAHYLDVSAELDTIEGVSRRDAEARARGIMVMPAVGFDVVPSDCLALHVARRLRGPRRLAIGVAGLELMSHGSAKTMLEQLGRPIRIRRAGAVVDVPPGSLERALDYGAGPRPSLAVGWGDVCTAYYTTGIPDIEVYFEATPLVRMAAAANRRLGWFLGLPPVRSLLGVQASALPDGPTAEERARRFAVIVAEVQDATGRRAGARLRTPEAYTFTCTTALAIVERVLKGDIEIGFQTPARVYGPDFVLPFAGVSREDVDCDH
jgi:short subunit dehydrogenase-like uncharacterized protein